MALPNARNQYLKTQIETATKEQLVVMLFDGIVRFTEQARKAIEGGDIENSHHTLMRAQAIIMELICTIDKDKGGEVANNLMSLHAYAFNCLIVCNMKKDVAKIDEVQKIYRDLRDAWVGAMDSLGISTNSGKSPVAPAAPAGAPPRPTPAAGNAGSGIMAAAKPAAVLANLNPAVGTELASGMAKSVSAANAADGAAVSAVSAAPRTSGYGMGKSALMGSLLNRPAAAAAPQTAPHQSAAGTVASPSTTRQNALLNAYGGGSRSIA